MAETRVRTAVIGVGHLGRHHARILSGLEGVDLVGVVDANPQRAEEIAEIHKTTALAMADLAGAVDAVVVATPTASHADVACPLLERGVAVLVEKPIARSLAEADAILAAGRAGGAIVAVGHTERFNPAVEAARSRLVAPRFIEVHRLGTFPDRSLDIDVVFDLMIHDLDIILAMVKSDVASFEAVGVPVLTSKYDIANVRLRFTNGCIANVTASRISRERVRKIRFFQPDSYVAVDYAAQELEEWRLVRPTSGLPAIEGGIVPVTNEEPLKRELQDFVSAVRDRRQPAVPGEDGRRALALAQQITERMTTVGER